MSSDYNARRANHLARMGIASADDIVDGKAYYRVSSTTYSSKHGAKCELCGGGNSREIFIQTRERGVVDDGERFLTHEGTVFGHEECLAAGREAGAHVKRS